jgi:hypothetical protein
MIERVREHAERVARAGRHVRIADEPLRELAEKLKGVPVPQWDGELHFFDGTEKSALYVLLLDAMNFCFWQGSFETEYRGKRYGQEDGYCALSVALKRAFEENDPILTDPTRLAEVTPDELGRSLRCEGVIPLLDERAAHARDLGKTLAEKYGGDVRVLLERAGHDAASLAAELATNFSCYADSRAYDGIGFPVLKRAQICASDLAGSFSASGGVGALAGADKLTCFADYKLPQLFHNDGVFVYTGALDKAVRSRAELAENAEEEVEIRANTIVAVSRIKSELAALGRVISEREIDWLLWNESVKPGRLAVPHHRTVTTSY